MPERRIRLPAHAFAKKFLRVGHFARQHRDIEYYLLVDGIEAVITNDDTIEIIRDRSECEFALLVGVLACDWGAMQLKLNQGSTWKIAPGDVYFPNDIAELLGAKRTCADKEKTQAGEGRS